MTTYTETGSGRAQGILWSRRAADWADVQEGQSRALFDAVLERVPPSSGNVLLDVGCGAGGFCERAAARGFRVAGFDAADELIAIARRRLRLADFHRGDMEALPHPAGTFDAVTGINAFQYAADPVHALAEARRVAKPGAPVVIATWGRADCCEASGYLAALGSMLPPPPPGTPGPFALSDPAALRTFATRAGLHGEDTTEVSVVWQYADLSNALRGLLSVGPAARAIDAAGEPAVRDAVTHAIAPYRTSTGAYRLENVFTFLVARAT